MIRQSPRRKEDAPSERRHQAGDESLAALGFAPGSS